MPVQKLFQTESIEFLYIIAAMLGWKFFRYKAVAVSWLVIMCVLFFLPGSVLPEENWLTAIHFDKWVHTGLFAGLLFLWASAFGSDARHYHWYLLAAALLYGIAVEFIQLLWVANRSFDLTDVVADLAGAVLGLWIWRRVYKKNKPL